MFLLQAPPVREATLYSEVPDRFRRRDVRSPWADANRGGHAVVSFLEGPVFDDFGNLFVTDIPFGRIFRITPSLQWELVVEYDGEPNGMKFLDAQHLVIADYRNGLMVVDVARGSIRGFLERRNTERFQGVRER